MMDLETIAPADFGRGLRGLGVNLLCRDVERMARFLESVFGLALHRVSSDFALARHGEVLMQLHSDTTFGQHPLSALLPETPPRGAGLQLYLFGIDPDHADPDDFGRSAAAGRLFPRDRDDGQGRGSFFG